jgi:hypothetical protein
MVVSQSKQGIFMRVGRSTKHSSFAALLCVPALLFFVGIGWILLHKAGMQADEVMFVYDLWHPQSAASLVSIFKHHMPLMLMSYLGALKSWLYAPILFFAGPSKESLRLPTLLLATGTMIIGGVLVRRIAGSAAGILLVWLLATDVTFLFTAVFDWGPVVLQNLLLAGGLFFVVEWWHSRQGGQNESKQNAQRRAGNWMLFSASFIFGLALWDKALFAWNLSAMIIAVAVLNPRAVLRTFRFIPLVLIGLGLALGAYPLIRFNAEGTRSTLGENAHFTFQQVAPKAKYLQSAVDGRDAESGWSDLDIVKAKGLRRPGVLSSWRFPFSLVVLPLGLLCSTLRVRRWIAFFLLSAGIAWFQSAITIGAGGSIHHSVLIWLFVYAALALSIAAIAERGSRLRNRHPANTLLVTGHRWIAICAFAAAGIICLRGVQTINLTNRNLSDYSHIVQWTDADTPLCLRLEAAGVKRVVAVDWGIANVVATETADRVSVIDETFELASSRFDKDRFLNCTEQDCLVVAHVPGRELFRQSAAFLKESMRSLHLDEAQVSTISDSHGSPSFLVYRVKKQ